MAGLTYMCSLIGEEEGVSEELTLQMWTVSTLISVRHGELQLLAGIMRRRMEMLLQGASPDQLMKAEFIRKARFGILSWMQAAESNFLSLHANWLLVTLPNHFHLYRSTLIGAMQGLLHNTQGQLEVMLVSKQHAILDLTDGMSKLTGNMLGNMVSHNPLLGPLAGARGSFRRLTPPLAKCAFGYLLTYTRPRQIPRTLWRDKAWKVNLGQKHGKALVLWWTLLRRTCHLRLKGGQIRRI